ncbi:uncharacterized protein LOC132746382 [Ruditapes philippinarum]|uniref:uncharacterized protein LOC132746382 n=1 Tax=Ruditapes philippinarum TaxID=129788 RepID=UPI00295BF61B|nr:uncharacterized protein LOC132746382 [Ruditapes philippinarum]
MPKTKKKSIKQQQAADKLRKRKKVQYPHQSVTLQETGITTTCNSKLPVSPEPSTSQLSSESTDFSAVVEVQRFAPVLFSPEALTNLIGDSSTEIPDDIVSASLILMQMHATSDTNCSVGQYTPAELHLAGTGAIVLPQPHLDKDIINIHPLTRHWVCSYYKTSTKELFVFDSLRSDTHLQEVIDQLKYIFTEEIVSHVIYASETPKRKSKQKCRADPVKRQRLISIDSESEI